MLRYLSAAVLAACALPAGAAEVDHRCLADPTCLDRALPDFDIGDRLPPGRYFMLLGSEYYGLPPVDGFWRYYRVDGRVLRVRPDTLEVIGDATQETNAAF